MRKLVVGILLGLISIASSAARAKQPSTRFVTVAQLEQALAADQGVKDKKLAREIADMKLTERLSDAEEARLAQALPGKQSRLAILAIADESAFLDPPPSEIPNLPPPSRAEQTALINKAIQYAIRTTREWPNFFATRITTRFDGTSVAVPASTNPLIEAPGHQGDQRLSSSGTTKVGVVYRDGREEYANGRKGLEQECGTGGIPQSATTGEFGELLALAAWEASQGTVSWSHWEREPDGRVVAVFQYAAKVVHKITTDCPDVLHFDLPPLPVDARGEIDVNPADGSIWRVTNMERSGIGERQKRITAELDMMVEYGPVDIGGRIYLCPVQSVTLALITPLIGRQQLDDIARRYGVPDGLITEELNHAEFANYHVFRATVKVLPGGVANSPHSPPTTPPQH